ncbi:MAG: hypothetical protein M3Q27_07815 [Actinomycetota bacterium]|nr:hypothetical protein [Actinomycetota bacterium]
MVASLLAASGAAVAFGVATVLSAAGASRSSATRCNRVGGPVALAGLGLAVAGAVTLIRQDLSLVLEA